MFKYCWVISPIDDWDHAIVASKNEAIQVIASMLEKPRDGMVYKTYVPYDGALRPIYMCKADNNGAVYVFSDYFNGGINDGH